MKMIASDRSALCPLQQGIAVLALAGAAGAQSINIDFGAAAGSPPADYAAAGLAGAWNTIDAPIQDPIPDSFGPYSLVDLKGNPTGATVTVITAVGTFGPLQGAVPAPEGSDAQLLLDGFGGFSPDISQHVHFAGLAAGTYRVITYTWDWPVQLYAMAAFVDGSSLVQTVGGPWTGAHVLAVTHMSHTIDVTDGTVQIELVGAGPGSFFNGTNIIQGVQLWKIDEPLPCPADIAPGKGDGSVSVIDLLTVINHWGEPGGVADVNSDGMVNVSDLLLVIAAWGPCPGTTIVSCGEPDLGDCYGAHVAPGCSEPDCCSAICALDPFCCSISWDAICAGLANLRGSCSRGIHPNCGNPASGSCFESGDLLPGCDNPQCCAAVCIIDAFCCDFGWDSMCASHAADVCN